MNVANVLIGILAIGAVGFAILKERRRLPKKRSRFADRALLSDDEIYRQFYESTSLPKEHVIRIWREVADILELDSGRLRPTDSFDAELGPVEGYIAADELGELTGFYRRQWKESGREGSPPHLHTLDELVRTLVGHQ